MDKYQKETMEKLKLLMIKEIREIDSETRIASIYVVTMGCMKCPLQFECNHILSCNQNIIQAIRKGKKVL